MYVGFGVSGDEGRLCKTCVTNNEATKIERLQLALIAVQRSSVLRTLAFFTFWLFRCCRRVLGLLIGAIYLKANSFG